MDTYEKKYKEALERMKIWVSDDTPDEFFDTHEVHTFVFPELAESEDEKIRKTLIDFFQDWHKNRSHCWGISVPKILAWLEKQSNPTDEEMKEEIRSQLKESNKQ